jgi:hypothetical protein
VTTRDEAVRVLRDEFDAEPIAAAAIVGELAAAGLLRPDPTCACGAEITPRYAASGVCQNCYGTTDDPTGEDREALDDAVAWLDRDHFEDDGHFAGRCVFASDLPRILDRAGFARPRGPETETPAVTPEQVEEAALCLWRLAPDEYIYEWESNAWAYRNTARQVLAAALGIEVRAGDPR